MRLLALSYVFFLVGWPLLTLTQRTFADGWSSFSQTFSDPDVTHAILVTVEISAYAVMINTVFGVGMALLLVRYEFPGKRMDRRRLGACALDLKAVSGERAQESLGNL